MLAASQNSGGRVAAQASRIITTQPPRVRAPARPMADAVLQVAEPKAPTAAVMNHHEDQADRLFGAEAHRLHRVDGRQRDHRLDAGLVEHHAQHETAHVAVGAAAAQRVQGWRTRVHAGMDAAAGTVLRSRSRKVGAEASANSSAR